MTIPDPIEELRDLLKADAGVSAIAGDLVFGGGLPDAARAAMPQPAVVVSPAGGIGRKGRTRFRFTRIDTTCYGATLKQSWDLHRAVRQVLEELLRSGSVFSAEPVADGQNAIHPETQWPTCYASYRVLSATEA